MNRFGVRDTDQKATLGGAGVERLPAEAAPRAAMTPTGPMLGGLGISYIPRETGRAIWNDGVSDVSPLKSHIAAAVPVPAPAQFAWTAPHLVPAAPVPAQVAWTAPPAAPAAAPAPVSAQVGPTPTVTMPPAPASAPLLVSSGGGVQTPAMPSTSITVSAPSTGVVDGIAAWLGGSTPIFSYNVPNALLAGVVVLGFALLSSERKRR